METLHTSGAAGSTVLKDVPVSSSQIRIKGKNTQVPSVAIDGITIFVEGKWLRVARVFDDTLYDSDPVRDPKGMIAQVASSALGADLFTFTQMLPDQTVRHPYYHEFDNFAVVEITTYKQWWDSLSNAVTRGIKRATKAGVEVREVPFSDEFVRGIQGIYDETPVRQGRPFWHYKKDFEAVKAENSTYAERNIFLGAYFGDELIGFVRLTVCGKVAQYLQILSKEAHQDKRPTNALIAKSVEVCEQRGLSHLVYGNYVYQDRNSSLTEFKRRNGFQPIYIPRYYVPLTAKGRLCLRLKLHHGPKYLLPESLLRPLLQGRRWFAETILRRAKESRSDS